MSNNRILSLFIIIILLLTSCVKLHKEHRVVEPINIQILDESRIENMKIRHIFKEFLLKDIVEKGKERIIVFHQDTLSNEDIHSGYIEYIISFDIMDYGTFSIEKMTDKILASVKIIKCRSNVVLCSFIESEKGRDIEKMCEYVAGRLGDAVVKKIFSLHKPKYEVPDVLSEPEDSSQTQE